MRHDDRCRGKRLAIMEMFVSTVLGGGAGGTLKVALKVLAGRDDM